MHVHSTASALSKLGVQRSLNVPECATEPGEVYELAKRRGMDFVTITDHDTIAGALALADMPDTFISEELTAWFKGEPQAVHVLCYGITPDDHEWLQAHSGDVEGCAEYLHSNEITRSTMGAADPCPIEFSTNLDDRDKVNRAVIVGPLMATGTQIAVGSPAVTGVGHVSIFDVDVTTGTFTCSAMLAASDVRFGRSMALVDLDGQGGPDHLLVGAPPTHAYLYTLPLSTGQAPAAMVTETGSTAFGTAVAALNIDGTAGDEMFVGDPDAKVGGKDAAGRVTVYGGAMMKALSSTAFPNPLSEHDPGDGHAYGSGIVSMTFCPANVGASSADGGASDGGAGGGVAACAPLPVIGATSKVYTYFGLKKPDPRVK